MNVAKKILSNVSPTFKHQCDACRFLGKLDGVDMYVCGRDGSLVRRFGLDSSAYGALPGDMVFPAGSVYAFAAALAKVAKEQGRKYVPHSYVTRPGVGRTDAHFCAYGCEHCDGEGGHYLPETDQYAPG